MRHISVVFLLVTTCLTRYVLSYSTCTNRTQNFQGYTYDIDTVTLEKVWSHCKFYNPRFDSLRCGIDGSTDQHYVCDPDRIITSQVLAVDSALKAIQAQTSTRCTAPNGEKQSYIVAMALINRIRIPDLSNPGVCINSCGEIHPVLNTSARLSSDQKNSIMANFANYLRQEWDMGACENDVIVFYCREFNLLYVSVGREAAQLVTPSVVNDIISTFSSYKDNDKIAEGLLAIAEELRFKLRSLTPAHILLILNILGLISLTLFLVFFLHLRGLDYNVWGREGVWHFLEEAAYWLSGAWLIKGLMYMVMYTSVKAPWSGILATLMAGIVLVTLFVYENNIFKEQFVLASTNTTL